MLSTTFQGFGACLVVASAGINAQAQVSITPIAVTGQAVPGLPQTFYSNIIPSSINNQGQVALWTLLSGPGAQPANDLAILAGLPDQLLVHVREGQPIEGSTLSSLDPISATLSDVGLLAYRGQLADLREIIGTAGPANVDVIALEGQTAPGLGTPNVYGGLLPLTPLPTVNGAAVTPAGHAVSQNGTIFFGASINENLGVNPTALFSGRVGDVELITNVGSPAPLAGEGATMSRVIYNGSTISTEGEVVYAARLVGPGILSEDEEEAPANNFAIYSVGNGTRIVARSGNPAPGLPGERFIGQEDSEDPLPFTDVAITPSGRVRFIGRVGRFTQALYVGDPAAPTLVARANRPAPEIGGASYTELFLPASNNADQVAFVGAINTAGPDNVALVTGTPDALRVVARGNEQTPGLPAGVFFGSAAANDEEIFLRVPFESVMINERGQVAFKSFLQGPAVNQPPGQQGTNDEAIFATDFEGNLQAILREGDPFMLAPGDSPTIRSLRPVAFNDDGLLLIAVQFSDNRTAALLAIVPEPGASVTALVLPALLSMRRRRP